MFENVKLILCDLDGSLLNDAKEIDSRIIDVIHQLQDVNIKLSIVSGRNHFAVLDTAEKLCKDVPYVCNNGANIYVNDKMIYKNTLDMEEKNQLLELLYANDIDFVFDSLEYVYAKGINPALEMYIKRLSKHFNAEFHFTLDDLKKKEAYKITLLNDDINEIIKVMNMVNQKFKKTKCTQSEGDIFVISDINTNKGEAVKHVAEYLNIGLDNIVVFGDNYNDLPMLNEVKYGVLMANASDDIKKYARYHTDLDNNHNGISDYITKYILKG